MQKSKYAETCKCYNCFSYMVCREKQCCQICSCCTLHIKNYIGKLRVLCYTCRFTEAYLHHLGLSHLHHVSPWSWGTLHALSWLPGENWKRAFTCHFSFIKTSFLFHSQTKYWQAVPPPPILRSFGIPPLPPKKIMKSSGREKAHQKVFVVILLHRLLSH